MVEHSKVSNFNPSPKLGPCPSLRSWNYVTGIHSDPFVQDKYRHKKQKSLFKIIKFKFYFHGSFRRYETKHNVFSKVKSQIWNSPQRNIFYKSMYIISIFIFVFKLLQQISLFLQNIKITSQGANWTSLFLLIIFDHLNLLGSFLVLQFAWS